MKCMRHQTASQPALVMECRSWNRFVGGWLVPKNEEVLCFVFQERPGATCLCFSCSRMVFPLAFDGAGAVDKLPVLFMRLVFSDEDCHVPPCEIQKHDSCLLFCFCIHVFSFFYTSGMFGIGARLLGLCGYVADMEPLVPFLNTEASGKCRCVN